MKKILCLLSALFMATFLSACASTQNTSSPESSAPTSSQESIQNSSSLEKESVENSSVAESSNEESVEESSESEEPEEVSPYDFTDFTDWEKKVLLRYVGEVIPFPANNEYGFEGFYEEDDYQNGINFFTIGNTEAEFNAYRRTLVRNGYKQKDEYMDEFGDTVYEYKKGDIVLTVSYYYHDSVYWIDVYAYSPLSDGVVDNDLLGGGNNEDVSGTDHNIMTNEGKGLPSKANGVYDVDFTKATYVKDVTDQGSYLDGCPTTGSPAVLVIPIEFSDVTADSKGYTINKIKTAFTGENSDTVYYSLHNYYYTASNGTLDLDITVLDDWFKPSRPSTYYENRTMTYYGSELRIGDQLIMNEALATLSETMDLSQFDSDNNGTIDSVILISTVDVDSDRGDFYWAYRFWNLYPDSNGDPYEYDGVSANDYIWAPYQFMHEEVKNGYRQYTNTSIINPQTYIHEFGHVLGADDYYDTAYVDHPMEGHDIMDAMMGDHNPYTKFNYGWLTSSRLVVAEDSITLTLEDFSKNGDTIIIANNWDDTLGAYQEYYVLVYYKNTGLNGGKYGYFSKEGILVYHVNASLYKYVEEGKTYYDIYNTNTNVSDESYGTEDNLIEFVLSTDGDYVYLVGDTISASTTDDQGNTIAYTFTVDSLTDDTATITFTKND